MAVGAIQTRLVDQSLRCDANIIVETASARDSAPLRRVAGLRRDGYLSIPCL
ncbi:glutamate synthase central domain-containing protein [Shigella flexneri]